MIRGGVVVFGVRDVGSAVRFYVETLGMKLVEAGADAAVIDAGEGFHIGLERRPAGSVGAGTTASSTGATAPSVERAVRLYSKVAIAEAIAIYENRGVTFTTERIAGCTVGTFRDPDSNALALIEHTSAI